MCLLYSKHFLTFKSCIARTPGFMQRRPLRGLCQYDGLYLIIIQLCIPWNSAENICLNVNSATFIEQLEIIVGQAGDPSLPCGI